MPNRLARESSPYLLQHQDNPVDWYPWGEDALRRARDENKPILLSIGYSACHWCHVMAHECFENRDIAKLMNENFVNIKVDREERPDLDQIYQKVTQLITQSGGWPLTVFLTPDLKPFFGGTYFPPQDRYGRPGFPRLLKAIAQSFRDEAGKIRENASRMSEVMKSLEVVEVRGERIPDSVSLRHAAEALLELVDWDYGGIGGAPKFPNAMTLSFLWRVGAAISESDRPLSSRCQEAALLTLTKMAEGGIFDQLGGGFHRYATDASWNIPHFEKMLYDNALLLKLYAEVLLLPEGLLQKRLTAGKRGLFLEILRLTVGYVLREMTAPEGGFYSAQDADSPGGPGGRAEEGKYYVWDPDELAKVLSKEEAEIFNRRFGVTRDGNFEDGKTVLYVAQDMAQFGDQRTVEGLLRSARAKLLAARARRIPPLTDDKILASWNGLMISGLSWAAKALGPDPMAEAARSAARKTMDFIVREFGFSEGRLRGVFCKGRATGLSGYLDDHAFPAQAALDLARFADAPEEVATNIARARNWASAMIKWFKDPEGPGYFMTSSDHEELLQRPKSIQDQAIPAGTAVTLACLLALGEIDFEGTGNGFRNEADQQLRKLYPLVAQSPFGFSELASAGLLMVTGPVVVSGRAAKDFCVHPHIFQKVPEKPELLICHRNTCFSPPRGEALEAVLRRSACIG